MTLAPKVLHDGDAAVSVGRSARRPREELHARRRGRAHDAHARLQRAASDGLGRVRPAGRERGDPARHRPGDVDDVENIENMRRQIRLMGTELRLDARDRDLRARVLPLESVALLAALRTRARVQARSAGQLVPARPNGARQRAGDRRALLALRSSGRAPQSLAVVLEDHRLRGSPARRSRQAGRLARAHAHDAAQLDRPQRRRRSSPSASTGSTRRSTSLRRASTRVYGATFLAVAPEHPVVERIKTIVSKKHAAAIDAFRRELALEVRTRAHELDGESKGSSPARMRSIRSRTSACRSG